MSVPSQEELMAVWKAVEARKTYLANYAKKRRESDNGKALTQANSRAYYWNHREEILAKRHLVRSALPPSEPTPSSVS